MESETSEDRQIKTGMDSHNSNSYESSYVDNESDSSNRPTPTNLIPNLPAHLQFPEIKHPVPDFSNHPILDMIPTNLAKFDPSADLAMLPVWNEFERKNLIKTWPKEFQNLPIPPPPRPILFDGGYILCRHPVVPRCKPRSFVGPAIYPSTYNEQSNYEESDDDKENQIRRCSYETDEINEQISMDIEDLNSEDYMVINTEDDLDLAEELCVGTLNDQALEIDSTDVEQNSEYTEMNQVLKEVKFLINSKQQTNNFHGYDRSKFTFRPRKSNLFKKCLKLKWHKWKTAYGTRGVPRNAWKFDNLEYETTTASEINESFQIIRKRKCREDQTICPVLKRPSSKLAMLKRKIQIADDEISNKKSLMSNDLDEPTERVVPSETLHSTGAIELKDTYTPMMKSPVKSSLVELPSKEPPLKDSCPSLKESFRPLKKVYTPLEESYKLLKEFSTLLKNPAFINYSIEEDDLMTSSVEKFDDSSEKIKPVVSMHAFDITPEVKRKKFQVSSTKTSSQIEVFDYSSGDDDLM